MKFASQPMTLGHANKISRWAYEPPYDFYNMDTSEESINELLSRAYRIVKLSGEIHDEMELATFSGQSREYLQHMMQRCEHHDTTEGGTL